ncbi:MAG: hypothetical protein FWC79_00800 [Oscillospiraceae bacterium]|nr:hypothetical protein [Oscillospiraceae bacterium]
MTIDNVKQRVPYYLDMVRLRFMIGDSNTGYDSMKELESARELLKAHRFPLELSKQVSYITNNIDQVIKSKGAKEGDYTKYEWKYFYEFEKDRIHTFYNPDVLLTSRVNANIQAIRNLVKGNPGFEMDPTIDATIKHLENAKHATPYGYSTLLREQIVEHFSDLPIPISTGVVKNNGFAEERITFLIGEEQIPIEVQLRDFINNDIATKGPAAIITKPPLKEFPITRSSGRGEKIQCLRENFTQAYIDKIVGDTKRFFRLHKNNGQVLWRNLNDCVELQHQFGTKNSKLSAHQEQFHRIGLSFLDIHERFTQSAQKNTKGMNEDIKPYMDAVKKIKKVRSDLYATANVQDEQDVGLEYFIPKSLIDAVNYQYMFNHKKQGGNERKNGSSAHSHPERVARLAIQQGYTSPLIVAVCHGHDLFEDTKITQEELKALYEQCGNAHIAEHAEEIVEAIGLLTKPELRLKKVAEGKSFIGKSTVARKLARGYVDKRMNKHYAEINDNEIARIVKILDRVCNISEPKFENPKAEEKHLEKYFAESHHIENLADGTSLEKLVRETTEKAKNRIRTR